MLYEKCFTMFGKIKMYVEYEHEEEWGSWKLCETQLANWKQKNEFIKVWRFKRDIMYCIKSSAKKLAKLAILYMMFKALFQS